jgi:hypothetical protein
MKQKSADSWWAHLLLEQGGAGARVRLYVHPLAGHLHVDQLLPLPDVVQRLEEGGRAGPVCHAVQRQGQQRALPLLLLPLLAKPPWQAAGSCDAASASGGGGHVAHDVEGHYSHLAQQTPGEACNMRHTGCGDDG